MSSWKAHLDNDALQLAGRVLRIISSADVGIGVHVGVCMCVAVVLSFVFICTMQKLNMIRVPYVLCEEETN